MQKYCGCVFSEEDRYKERIEKDKKRSATGNITIAHIEK